MKRSLSFLSILLAIILSCNTSPTSNGLLNETNLPLQEYTISIDKDTTLVTKNGALLKIPKGALTTDKGNSVTLEIKEAYSLQQIIQAGLVTQSNGEPLSSGGMIYINAKGGQDVKITQAIKVALPANYLADSMQLYKGRKDENGNINWEEPSKLTENKQLSSVQQGKLLFQTRCAKCHGLGQATSGPDLAHFMKRFSDTIAGNDYKYYEHSYLPDKEKEFESHENLMYYYDHLSGYERYKIYKCNLIKSWAGLTGPVLFSDSTGDELLDVYRYIQNESDRRQLSLPVQTNLYDCADSCAEYKKSIAILRYRKEKAASKKEELIMNNGMLVEEEKNNVTRPGNATVPVDFEEKVSPQNFGAEYYQFTIESFGWYNIDILVTGINGVEESELFVRITGEYREKTKVYLIIPSVKVYVEGGAAARNKEEFAFHLKNGKISLPQNAKAYILAVTETEASIAFALKEFTTSLKQEFDISLTASTKEKFNATINGLSLDSLGIKVKDTKNATEIRKTNNDIKKIEQELKKAEGLKPKNCDCDCSTIRDNTARPTVNNEINSADIIDYIPTRQ